MVRSAASTVYIVAASDSLPGVALKHGMSPSELKQLNGLQGVNQLFPGQVLKVKVEDNKTSISREKTNSFECLNKFTRTAADLFWWSETGADLLPGELSVSSIYLAFNSISAARDTKHNFIISMKDIRDCEEIDISSDSDHFYLQLIWENKKLQVSLSHIFLKLHKNSSKVAKFINRIILNRHKDSNSGITSGICLKQLASATPSHFYEHLADEQASLKSPAEGLSSWFSRLSESLGFTSNATPSNQPESKIIRDPPKRKIRRVVKEALWLDSSKQSKILNHDEIEALLKHLPMGVALSYWELLYCFDNGVSLDKFYARTKDCSPTLLLIQTTRGDVFGFFGTEAWKASHGSSFYGTGDSFVFTIRPKVEFFKWTRKNSLFMHSEEQCIAVGSGGGFAICLEEGLEKGTSSACETFGNTRLCASEPEASGSFTLAKMEVFGFDSCPTHKHNVPLANARKSSFLDKGSRNKLFQANDPA